MNISRLRAVLASEGLRKEARGDRLVSYTAYIGMDTRYSTTINVDLEGDKVTVTLSTRQAVMGMDGPGGSYDPETSVFETVPADGRSVAASMKAAFREDSTLKMYGKLKDVQWHIPRGYGVTIKGVSAKSAQMAIDAWEMMDDVEWKAKWEKPKSAPVPSAGPLADIANQPYMADIARFLKAKGYPLLVTGGRKGILENGRRWKSFKKDLLASADSVEIDGSRSAKFTIGPHKFVYVKRRVLNPKRRSWGDAWELELLR